MKVHRNVSLEEQTGTDRQNNISPGLNSCHTLGENNKPRKLASRRWTACGCLRGQIATADLTKGLARSLVPRDDDLLIKLAPMRLLSAAGCWPEVAKTTEKQFMVAGGLLSQNEMKRKER